MLNGMVQAGLLRSGKLLTYTLECRIARKGVLYVSSNAVIQVQARQTTLGVKKEPASARILQGKMLDVFQEFKRMDVIK